MKKLTTLFGVLLFSLSFSASVSAESWFTSKVKNVYPLGEGFAFILIFESVNPTCSGAYHYVQEGKNGVTEKGLQYLFSTALTALSTDKSLSIAYDETSSYCYVNRLHIRR